MTADASQEKQVTSQGQDSVRFEDLGLNKEVMGAIEELPAMGEAEQLFKDTLRCTVPEKRRARELILPPVYTYMQLKSATEATAGQSAQR